MRQTPLIDVHAHLAAPEFEADLDDVLRRAAGAGVDRIVCVGTDLPSSRRSVELARRSPERIAAAVGIQPNQGASAGPQDMAEIERLGALPEVAAIGETGLDFRLDFTSPQRQVELLREHLRLARGTGKPLILHCRAADDELLELLMREGGELRGVRHCFLGPAELAMRYAAAGFHLSFTGAITRPGYKKAKAALRALPADRLLLETDCPYQAPAARAGVRNEPAFLLDTARAAAAIRNESVAELARLTSRNAESLFFPPGRGL
ncbi:MAG: TatD family hydrolase [Planctomycetota bacterium]|jgi:TatD DNase family protein